MAQEIRLYFDGTLAEGMGIDFPANKAHYLANVMRVKTGDNIFVFNGKDGQFQAEISCATKKNVSAVAIKQTRLQENSPDLWLAFAPIKNKCEIVVEKATELGVSQILPVVTQRSIVRSVNLEKMATYAEEAAEQCERLDIPQINPYSDLSKLLGDWDSDRILLYGDESGGGEPLTNIIHSMPKESKLAVLIGPEGGFTPEEFAMLRAQKFSKGFGMGERIMRADTAAIAAIAYIQAATGNWEGKPHFL